MNMDFGSTAIFVRLRRNPSAVVIANAATQSMIRLVSNILLARMLMPTAFALTSITMLILTGIQMISDVGIAVMTLRHGPMSEGDQARMWTMQFIRGVALALVMFLIAEPIAALYQSPELANVLRVLSIMPAIQGAQSLYPILALARRDLMPTFWVDVVGRMIGAMLSVAAAILTPTVWALVIGTLAQVIFSAVLSHVLSGKGWPRFKFDSAFIRSHWAFSRWIQLGSTFTFVGQQIDKVLFPFLFGLATFGVYGIGASFAVIPAQITQRWSANVFYPLVVQNIHAGEAARNHLRRVRLTMLFYGAIVAAAMIGVTPSFFHLLYKPAYHEAARFAELLTAAFFFEVAESSLRHFPLVDFSPRFEFWAVVVRLTSFLFLVAMIWEFGGSSHLYALGFTTAQACSYLFMLVICARKGYVRPGPDLVVAAILSAIIFAAYLLPNTPSSTMAAVINALVVSLVALAALAFVYIKRGLPSVSQDAAPESSAEAAKSGNRVLQ